MKSQRRFFLSRVLVFVSAGLPFFKARAFAASYVPKSQRSNSFHKLRYRIVFPQEKARHKDDPLSDNRVVDQVDLIDREFIEKGPILNLKSGFCGDCKEFVYDFRDISAFNQWLSRMGKALNHVSIVDFGYQFETQYV